MLLDNTTVIRGIGVSTPKTWLKQHGYMAGLGDATDAFQADQQTGMTTAITAANMELVFLANYFRQLQGKAPLDPRYTSPSVNVGLSPDTQQFLLYGGLALFAFAMVSKRKGRLPRSGFRSRRRRRR